MSRRVVNDKESRGLYGTPRWTARSIVEHLGALLPAGVWLEPGAGDGSLMAAISEVRPDVRWVACDIEDHGPGLLQRLVVPWERPPLIGCDFLLPETLAGETFPVAIANPPFPLAREFVERMMQLAEWVVVLQRLDWLAGADMVEAERDPTFLRKRDWFRLLGHRPALRILPNRPKFEHRQDSGDYAWYVWRRGYDYAGIEPIDWLPVLPRQLRSENRRQQRLIDESTVGGHLGQPAVVVPPQVAQIELL